MKFPGECQSIEEIRAAIDSIDQEVISLLGKRYGYVKEIIRFKEPTKESVVAEERFNRVIATRRQMAIEAGLDADIIEKIYRELLNYFISQEMKLISKIK